MHLFFVVTYWKPNHFKPLEWGSKIVLMRIWTVYNAKWNQVCFNHNCNCPTALPLTLHFFLREKKCAKIGIRNVDSSFRELWQDSKVSQPSTTDWYDPKSCYTVWVVLSRCLRLHQAHTEIRSIKIHAIFVRSETTAEKKPVWSHNRKTLFFSTSNFD